MSSNDGKNLPPLPEEAHSALSALRGERPSPRFQHRLQTALQAAEAARASGAASRSGCRRGFLMRTHAYHPQARMLMGAALAIALLVVAGRMDGVDGLGGGTGVYREEFPSRQVSFRLPGEGAGWLELPWSRSVHSGEPAMVRLETPAGLDFHQHTRTLPSMQLVGCDAERCIHEFTADTGATAEPLRVRIDKPGRYEFRLWHMSDVRHVHERFVVVADH
ncbi:hypothetical protein [Vitiosangium sp. GDMCC 1.1324]|uniref:hypothetical protein n=1 Tax=Vitiosangium sp. (strain GDMCC 1.1324) TaxID=2138576 RepID=UPI000D383845|nr:hypothetical protein [Vitiosangium sp. GDMCC 1.1324]PTL76033.1 hypothetical protein DAT35_51850 [Vitiosangium sp. GDMCC 1.1324]